jgi:hypothetical protein
MWLDCSILFGALAEPQMNADEDYQQNSISGARRPSFDWWCIQAKESMVRTSLRIGRTGQAFGTGGEHEPKFDEPNCLWRHRVFWLT